MDRTALVSRAVLANNLAAILKDAKARGLSVEAWAKGLHPPLDPKHVRRVLRMQIGTTVDWLDLLARALNVQPWQLMVPGLDAKVPPRLELSPEDLAALEAAQIAASALMARLSRKSTTDEGDP